MFDVVKKAMTALGIAAMCMAPSIAGASAAINFVPAQPSELGNYIKHGNQSPAKILGLGRGYTMTYLSDSDFGNGNGMLMDSTAYSPEETSGYTATGDIVRYGIAAVDTSVIPLGTDLVVEGYGHALAADTGGSIVGNRIDLAFDTYSDAMSWGRRDVMVYAN